MLFLYGDTSVSGEWGAHKYGYTPQIIKATLECIQDFLSKLYRLKTRIIFSKEESWQNVKLSNIQSMEMDGNPQFLRPVKRVKSPDSCEIIVCTDIFSYIFSTTRAVLKQQQVIWCFSKPTDPLLSRLLLRPLCKYVSKIFVKNTKTLSFCKRYPEVFSCKNHKIIIRRRY